MNVNEKELARLKAMLEEYKQAHGSVSIRAGESTNCYGCTGSCNNFCTQSCSTYCDGHSSFCWRLR